MNDRGYPEARDRAATAAALLTPLARATRTFWGTSFGSPTGGQFTTVQLWNPAGSNRVVRVRSVKPNNQATTTALVRRILTPLATLVSRGIGRGVFPGVSVAELRTGDTAAQIGDEIAQVTGAAFDLLELFPPDVMVFWPNSGLALSNNAVTVTLRVVWLWEEWSTDEFAAVGSSPS